MSCASCGRDNPPSNAFCGGCGAKLSAACTQCGQSNPPDHKFCGHCGHHLAAASRTAAADRPEAISGERRQLTILFCDLVESSDLSARLDPEEYRAILQRYQRVAGDLVARHGGHVAQNLTDGMLAYFGWPRAYDDAAERAVRVALDMLEAAATIRVDGAALAVRLGLHTGSVVVSDVGAGAHHETLALGDAPNVAARVQSKAEPGQVLISAATHRLVSGMFVVENRGAHALKGVAQPIEIYRVLKPSGVRGRLATVADGGLTPFVNRSEERALLHSRFERACDGYGQVVLLVGEAGIGKSRLAQLLREEFADTPHTWLETGGAPYFANTPFYAVIQLLKQIVGWDAGEGTAARSAALVEVLAGAGLEPREALPFMAPLLDLPLPDDCRPDTAAPEVARKRLLAMLAAWVFGTARQQPLVILVEDLHWVDPSTIELQQLLVEQAATTPLLLLYTARPEFRVPWAMRSHHTQITLNRLPKQHVRELITSVAGRSTLMAEVIAAVMARTDGVPLFVEELTKTVLDAGTDAARSEIPATLADSLMARLDRLGSEARETAQIAAVCGREFSYALLRAVHTLSDAELDEALDKLRDAELIYPRGLPPDATYTFKHALVRDAAYGSLLKSRRRVLHGRVAAVLRQQFASQVEAHPELPAQHYTEAGDAEAAAPLWQRAGERAFNRGAAREAEHFLQRGLDVVTMMPEGSARDQAEFPLQLALGNALFVTKGYSATETTAAFARGLQVGERIAPPQLLAQLLLGLAVTALHRDGPGFARPLAAQAFSLVQRANDRQLDALAQLVLGMTSYQACELGTAGEQLCRGLELYDDTAAIALPVDPCLLLRTHSAFTSWQLGYADQARAHMREALARGQRSIRAADRVIAEQMAATLAALLSEPSETLVHAERSLAACAEEPNPVHGAVAKILRGWAIALGQEADTGLTEIRAGVDALVATGQRLGLELYYCLLADVHVLVGDVNEALRDLGRGEEACPTQLAHHAMTLGRRAELVVRGGESPDRIDASFMTAVDWARTHRTKAHELRITTRYAQWLCGCGRENEGRELVDPLVASFTEGFDTRDLAAARSLLLTQPRRGVARTRSEAPRHAPPPRRAATKPPTAEAIGLRQQR